MRLTKPSARLRVPLLEVLVEALSSLSLSDGGCCLGLGLWDLRRSRGLRSLLLPPPRDSGRGCVEVDVDVEVDEEPSWARTGCSISSKTLSFCFSLRRPIFSNFRRKPPFLDLVSVCTKEEEDVILIVVGCCLFSFLLVSKSCCCGGGIKQTATLASKRGGGEALDGRQRFRVARIENWNCYLYLYLLERHYEGRWRPLVDGQRP